MEAVTHSKQLARIRNALLGLAVCDAFGAPLEFTPRRYTRDYLVDMVPNRNFNLAEGHFTDDTSMALCLAHSLAVSQGKHDPIDQANRYVMWLDEGYMSSVPGGAFDVGNQTLRALEYWRRNPSPLTLEFVKTEFEGEMNCGNGSLMRVLPCGLVAQTELDAMKLGRASSEVTHPHQRCQDACALYSGLVFRALRGASKEDLAQALKEYLTDKKIDSAIRARLKRYEDADAFSDKPRDQISSSGYVLDSLEAALWAFFTTPTFEKGAIEVVNLGNDADTVGAIYGGLAGAFYGIDQCIPERWLSAMKEIDLVEGVVAKLYEISNPTIAG